MTEERQVITGEGIQAFKEFVDNHNHFLIMGPKNTDGDTIGTNVALAMYLKEQRNKKAVLYAPYPIDEKYKWMPGVDMFVTSFDPEGIDAVFSSDTAVPELFAGTPQEKEVLSKNVPWVNLDHHISNVKYGTLNLVDTNSSSCSMILYKLLRNMKATITPDMATHLLMSIYMDTGALKHPNTTEDTYAISAELVRDGADVQKVVKKLFKQIEMQKLKLWGLVLDRARLTADEVLVSAVTMEDIEACGATREDLEGIIDYLNHVPNKKFCLLLSEDGKGNVKGSLRTQSHDVDLNEIASNFGGGGHKMAAGFTIPGRLEQEVRWKIVPDIVDAPKKDTLIAA